MSDSPGRHCTWVSWLGAGGTQDETSYSQGVSRSATGTATDVALCEIAPMVAVGLHVVDIGDRCGGWVALL